MLLHERYLVLRIGVRRRILHQINRSELKDESKELRAEGIGLYDLRSQPYAYVLPVILSCLNKLDFALRAKTDFYLGYPSENQDY